MDGLQRVLEKMRSENVSYFTNKICLMGDGNATEEDGTAKDDTDEEFVKYRDCVFRGVLAVTVLRRQQLFCCLL